jgi:branched-subunit amino acid aminotransferase/4-amino-4-deoxychorismate lyase
VPLDDRAAQAGLGLFETLALRDGGVLELDLHLDRLRGGAERLGLDLPPLEKLRATVLEAAGEAATPCGWLKVVVTGEGRSFIYHGEMDPAEVGCSVSAVLVPWRRNSRDPLDGLKTLNYAGNLLGLEYARTHGADEGLWLNTRGHLAEGCTSNLFVVHGRKLFTPGEREGILPGVVRRLVIGAVSRLGWPLHEGRLRLPRLERAREAFLTSSVRGVRALVRFQGRPVGAGVPGPMTRRISAELARIRRVRPESQAGTPSGAGGGSPA